MDNDILQTLRYKLQKRLKRISTAGYQTYQSILGQSWGFLDSNPVVKGIFDDLERRVPSAEADGQRMIDGEHLTGENEREHVALCYWLIKKISISGGSIDAISIAHEFARGASKHDEALEFFTETFLEPLFDYIDEQLDDHRMILSLLAKYKHRVEWFHRD